MAPLLKIIHVVGALGLFIYGMKVMSEGVQRAAGSRFRNIMKSMTKNKFLGILTGLMMTGIIQSSSATSVMAVSLVNAGLINLVQSTGVIMGANIGTTVTVWLFSIFGFEQFNIFAVLLPILALGFVLYLIKRTKSTGEFLIGFGILLISLNMIKDITDLGSNPEALKALWDFTNEGFLALVVFMFAGATITLLVQSSTASILLTLTSCYNGWIPFEAAAAMILGENIGTTATALLASIVGNRDAKRTAWFHVLFNLIGVTWMILLIRPTTYFINEILLMDLFGLPSMIVAKTSVPLGIAIFHSGFNITNTLLLIGFSPQLLKITAWLTPNREFRKNKRHLEYFSAGFLAAAELSILESKREIIKLGELTIRMLRLFKPIIINHNTEYFKESFAKIKKYEKISDAIEVEIVQYLIKISENQLTFDTSKKVRNQLSMVKDLERIADIFKEMSKTIKRKKDQNIWFAPEQRNDLLEMFYILEDAFDIMLTNLKSEDSNVDYEKAEEIQKKFSKKKNAVRKKLWSELDDKNIDIKSGLIYNDLYLHLEQLGDKLINISEALVGKI